MINPKRNSRYIKFAMHLKKEVTIKFLVFQAVIESMAGSQEPSEQSLFVIDTQGAGAGDGDQEKPVKKLKRRNAAIYTDGD